MRKRIDWVRLMQDLSKASWSQKQVATRVESSQPAMWRLAHGAKDEPPHSVGEALLTLHREVCGDEKHAEIFSVASVVTDELHTDATLPPGLEPVFSNS